MGSRRCPIADTPLPQRPGRRQRRRGGDSLRPLLLFFDRNSRLCGRSRHGKIDLIRLLHWRCRRGTGCRFNLRNFAGERGGVHLGDGSWRKRRCAGTAFESIPLHCRRFFNLRLGPLSRRSAKSVMPAVVHLHLSRLGPFFFDGNQALRLIGFKIGRRRCGDGSGRLNQFAAMGTAPAHVGIGRLDPEAALAPGAFQLQPTIHGFGRCARHETLPVNGLRTTLAYHLKN